MSTRNRKLTREELAEALEDWPAIVSPAELAKRLGRSVKTIYRWIEDDRLEGTYRKRGNHIFFFSRRVITVLFNGPDWRNV